MHSPTHAHHRQQPSQRASRLRTAASAGSSGAATGAEGGGWNLRLQDAEAALRVMKFALNVEELIVRCPALSWPPCWCRLLPTMFRMLLLE